MSVLFVHVCFAYLKAANTHTFSENIYKNKFAFSALMLLVGRYWPTWVVQEKGPFNGCVCVSITTTTTTTGQPG